MCELSLFLFLKGSIQQLVLTADPTAPNEQCEEDDPYVSNLHDFMTLKIKGCAFSDPKNVIVKFD